MPPGQSPIEAVSSLKHSSEWLPTHPGGRGGSDPAPAQSSSNASSLGLGDQSSPRTGRHGQPLGRRGWRVQWSRNMRKAVHFTKLQARKHRLIPHPSHLFSLKAITELFHFQSQTNEVTYWLWVLLGDGPQSHFVPSLRRSVFISSTKLGCPYGWGLQGLLSTPQLHLCFRNSKRNSPA